MPQKLKFKEYPILKLLVGLIIGIIAAHAGIELTIQWYYWLIGILVLGGLAWPKKYLFNYNYRFISGFIIYFVFVLFGFLLYQFQSNSKQENYYGNLLSFDNQYIVRIIDLPQQKPKSIKLFVEVHSVLSNDHLQPSIGKALIYLQNDSFAKQVYYGDLLAIDSDFSPIAASSNPDQFDYKSYLSLQDIHYQSYIRSGSWKLLEHTTGFDIKLFALKLRAKLIEILYANQLSEDELSVAAGMLLGVRDMLSPDLKQAYAGAGAMHILCVSGLHVGIIFLILNSVLGALNYRKSHRALKALLILSFIWFYALLTGLSPSVVRSATMFTFIVIGQNVNRHVNILGSLSASALVILVVQPNLLFDLGFQLSYSAVVSIVVLQKPIASLWNPPNLILDKAWQLIAVSVAAQIGTAPISLYYFHQFPNLFILTNLLVIPAAYLVINLGIAVLALSFIYPVY
jgi:competence protein ComEC